MHGGRELVYEPAEMPAETPAETLDKNGAQGSAGQCAATEQKSWRGAGDATLSSRRKKPTAQGDGQQSSEGKTGLRNSNRR